jgi:hypothetical protein
MTEDTRRIDTKKLIDAGIASVLQGVTILRAGMESDSQQNAAELWRTVKDLERIMDRWLIEVEGTTLAGYRRKVIDRAE